MPNGLSMNIIWPFRSKPHILRPPVSAADLDDSLNRLFQDMARQAAAIEAYQVNVALGNVDLIGTMPPTRLGGAVTPDLTKFYREDGSFSVPPYPTGASGIRAFFGTHMANAWTDYGCTSSSIAGVRADQFDSGGMFSRWTTAAVANSQGGPRLTGNVCWIDHNPDIICRLRTGADITAVRYWIGLFNGGFPSTGEVGLGRSVGVRYSTVAGDTSWVGFYADNTPTTTTTAAIGSIAASTIYDIRIQVTGNGTSVTFTINGAQKTLAMTNATGVACAAAAFVVCSTGTAKAFDFQRLHLETN